MLRKKLPFLPPSTCGGALLLALFLVSFSSTYADVKYRTFLQSDFETKKGKAGRVIGIERHFAVQNRTNVTVYGAEIYCTVLPITYRFEPSGTTTVNGTPVGNSQMLTGSIRIQQLVQPIAPNEVLHYYIPLTSTANKRVLVTAFQWLDANGLPVGEKTVRYLTPLTSLMYAPHNGASISDYLFRKVIGKQTGLVLGIPQKVKPYQHGWVVFKKADLKFFSHTEPARCLDLITNNASQKPFIKEFRNPQVKKHDNRLLGELHALKLAIVANDAGVSEPIDPASTSLGDLIYQNSVDITDPLNGRTLRQIAQTADSALTYCGAFEPAFYGALVDCISRVNQAFHSSTFDVTSREPLVVQADVPLTAVTFIQPNPTIGPMPRTLPVLPEADLASSDVPEQFTLNQNYPNPFNPTTTIEFSLDVPAEVSLNIYNVLGEHVATLIDREFMDDGMQSVEFEASDLSSGMYLYQLEMRGTDEESGAYHRATKKMFLVK